MENDPGHYIEPYFGFDIRVEKGRALMGGTQNMRLARYKYLSLEEGESQDNYDRRINRSSLYNMYRKTIEDHAGRVFRKPLVIDDKVDKSFDPIVDDISRTGQKITDFAQDVFTQGLQTGIHFIHIDAPTYVGRTISETKNNGFRPYFVSVAPENLLGWQQDIINNRLILTQVRIKEIHKEKDPDNEFLSLQVEYVRVMDKVGSDQVLVRLYRKRTEKQVDNWDLIEETTLDLSGIPLVPFYAQRKYFMMGAPPLDDLADINIAHWQSSSDQTHILHYTRLPILFGAGWPKGTTLKISSSQMVTTQDPTSDLKYVEPQGQSIAAGQKDIDKLEMQMEVLGMQLLARTSGPSTATGEMRGEIKETSQLGMMAKNLERALNKSFEFAAEFLGVGEWPDDGVRISTELSTLDVSAPTLTLLLQSVTQGKISKETFWDELVRRGLLAGTFDPELETERLEAQHEVEVEEAMEFQNQNEPKNDNE